MNLLPEFCLLLIWRGHFISMLLRIFWLSCLSSLAYITSALWIGTLLALDMVNGTFYGLWKGVFFIFHSYSWALNLAVNAFKTDSALLDSWIKTMLPIMTAGCGLWPVKKAWAFLFPWRFLVLHYCPVQPTNVTFQRPSCVHDIWPACNDGWNTTEYPAVTTSRGTWWLSILNVLLKSCDASPKCCHPLGSCTFFLPFEQIFLCCALFSFGCCVLFSTRIWLCLTPGEFPLLG